MTNERRHKRVLYAEASDLVQETHGGALEGLNCGVVSVASAQAALDELSTGEPFDLILLGDVAKPIDSDYLEVQLSMIKKVRLLDAHVPILLFSSIDYISQAKESGATDQMVKPAGIRDFMKFITPHLGDAT